MIEAALEEEELDYPVVPWDAEVTIDFEGSIKTCQMKMGDGRYGQARHVQETSK